MTIRALFLLSLCLPVAAQQFLWIEQSPGVVKSGQPVKLRVRANGFSRLVYEPDGGGPAKDFTGVGQGLFEVEITAPPVQPRHLFQRFVGNARGFIGSTQGAALNLNLRYSDFLPPVRITPLAADAQRSNYVMNIHHKQFYDRLLSNPAGFTIEREPSARRFYQLMGDDYDFLVYTLGSADLVENRFHGNIRNIVTGIGTQAFDNGATYGSPGRLLGFSFFPNAFIFDPADRTYNHEQAHQWINYSPNAPFAGTGGHWPISTMATGIMGFSSTASSVGGDLPCRFVLQPDGRLATQIGPIGGAFTDLDLYLMGLIPAEEVSPQYVITDAQKIAAARTGNCNAIGTMEANQFQTVTAQNWISLHGTRQPAFPNAKKDFRVAFLVLSRDGLLSPEEMAYFDTMARRVEERGQVPSNVGRSMSFSNPWFTATGGRSTVNAKLSTESVPVISHGGTVNAASFSGTQLGPGTVASVFGSDLARTTASATSVPLPTTLGGVRVLVNGTPAPLFFASPTQINFQMPTSISIAPIGNDTQAYAVIHVERDGVASNLAFPEVRAVAAGIITYGEGLAVATNASGVIGPANPAIAGETITVYWVGSAPLSEPIGTGQTTPLDRLVNVTVSTGATVDGLPQPLTFMGLTPGSIGLYQANIRLSAGLTTGVQDLQLRVGSTNSNTVKLHVRRP